MDTKLVAKVGLNNPNNDKALIEKYSRDETFSIPVLARYIITVTPRRRVEQTLEENRSHQSQGMLRGKRDCMVLTEYSACTI